MVDKAALEQGFPPIIITASLLQGALRASHSYKDVMSLITSTLPMEAGSLQNIGVQHHPHKTNCLRRFHCIQGHESFKPYTFYVVQLSNLDLVCPLCNTVLLA